MDKRVALVGKKSVEYLSKLIDIWNSLDCACLFDYNIPTETLVVMLKEANVDECYVEEGLHSELRDALNLKITYYLANSSSIQLVKLNDFVYLYSCKTGSIIV